MSRVLIRVLVEDGLGAEEIDEILKQLEVLILVLVEDGLGVAEIQELDLLRMVLILVLVEDGLGELYDRIAVPEANVS